MNKTNIDFLNMLHAELRKRRGSLKIVAQRAGRDRNWVRMVLVDGYKDNAVVLAAAEVLEELRKEENDAIKKVKDLVQNLA